MRLAAAVDIGGTRVKVGIVREDGLVIKRASIATSDAGEPTTLMDSIDASLRPMLEAAADAGHGALGVGVSVAGFLDPDHSGMIGNANLPALCGFPLKRAFEDRFSLDCRLEVDSNAAVIAEFRHGAGAGVERLLGVTVGTGLGGGVVIGGEVVRVTGECAGDLGHVIVSRSGRRCSCGARGCLEAMVSSSALSERGGGRVARDIIAAARAGEALARQALAQTGWWLGLGLVSLSPIFAPERIVVGGGIATAGDLLLEHVRSSYRARAASEFREIVEIVGSAFEGWEGMIGAASLVFEPMAATAGRVAGPPAAPAR